MSPSHRMNLDEALDKYFGYESFRPGQREVIQCLLDGQDVLGVFPTGAGKSLTYQLAALMLPGTAPVVSPLIAFIRAQVIALQARSIEGVSATSSTLTDQEAAEAFAALA